MAIDNLLVQLGINTKAYEQGLDKAGKMAGKFGGNLKNQLGAAFGGAAMISYVKSLTDMVAKWKDVSEQTGLTTDQVQQVEEQAIKSGLAIDDITQALSKLNTARRSALEGDTKATRGFGLFGVSLADLNMSRSALDIFKQMGLSAMTLGINTEKAAAMMDLLGRNGKRFQGVLKDINNEGVNILSETEIERIDAYEKLFNLMIQTSKVLSAGVLGRLLQGDFSDVGAILKGSLKSMLPQAGKPFFGYGANVAKIASDVIGGGIANAAFPRADLVTHGALPLPTSGAANQAQLRNDLEQIRIMKEVQKNTEKTKIAIEKIATTGALSSF